MGVNAAPEPKPDDARREVLRSWDEHRTLNPVVGHLCPYCAAARRRALGACMACGDLRRRHDRALGRLYVISLAGVDDPAYRWVAEWKDLADAQKREVNAFCIAIAVSLWWEQHAGAIAEYLDDDFVTTTLGTSNAVLRAAALAYVCDPENIKACANANATETIDWICRDLANASKRRVT